MLKIWENRIPRGETGVKPPCDLPTVPLGGDKPHPRLDDDATDGRRESNGGGVEEEDDGSTTPSPTGGLLSPAVKSPVLSESGSSSSGSYSVTTESGPKGGKVADGTDSDSARERGGGVLKETNHLSLH